MPAMNSSDLPWDQKTMRPLGLWDAWRISTFGFGLATLVVFGSWAFLGQWFYGTLGELGAYLAWMLLYLGIGGETLKGLLPEWSRWRFHQVFSLAFMAYALAWMVAWFALRNFGGEMLGALCGSVAMGWVLCLRLRHMREWLRVSVILFVSNGSGYFLGSWLHQQWDMPWGALGWGAAYGLMFGGGIGPAIWFARPGSSAP